MQTNIEREHSHALLVSPDDLKAISAMLAEQYESLVYSASCSEGSRLHSDVLNEVLDYENPSFRRIESFTLKAGDSYGKECIISIRGGSLFTYGFSISDDDDKRALKVADELTKRLRDCRPWYSVLARISPAVLAACLLIMWVTIGVWRRVLVTGKVSTTDVSFTDSFYIGLPFVVVAGLVFKYVDRGWRWMFPKIWFRIGRQSKELDFRAKVRGWIFGTVVLGLLLGVAGNLLTNIIVRE